MNVARLVGVSLVNLRRTPNAVATAPSGSERSGKSNECFSEKRFCFSTWSALIPTRVAPTASNSAFISRKWQLSTVHP